MRRKCLFIKFQVKGVGLRKQKEKERKRKTEKEKKAHVNLLDTQRQA